MESILSKDSWLHKLTPLVVLLTWERCTALDDTVAMLKKLLAAGIPESFLTAACDDLVYRCDLIEWTIHTVRYLS